MSNAKRTPDNNKKSTGNDKSGGKSNYTGNLTWISPSINDADKRWLSANSDAAPEHIFTFMGRLSAAYTLSSKYDDRTERWLTSLICTDEHHENFGCALTARGKSREVSIFILAYLFMVKLEHGWGVTGGNDDEWS